MIRFQPVTIQGRFFPFKNSKTWRWMPGSAEPCAPAGTATALCPFAETGRWSWTWWLLCPKSGFASNRLSVAVILSGGPAEPAPSTCQGESAWAACLGGSLTPCPKLWCDSQVNSQVPDCKLLIWLSCRSNSRLCVLPPFYILHRAFKPFTQISWSYPAFPAGKFAGVSLIFQPSLLALLFPFSFLLSQPWLQSFLTTWPLFLFPGKNLICICPSIQATNYTWLKFLSAKLWLE